MLGFGLDWWNSAMLMSLAGAALAAIAVLVTTRAVIVLQDREARDNAEAFAKYKLGAEERTAALERDAKAAQALISDANARALEAKLALEKFKSGRSLSKEQYSILVDSLKSSPKGKVIIKPNILNSEATRFAKQISAAFNEAGFSGVGDAQLNIVSYNRPGLFVVVRDGSAPPPDTEPILKALTAADVKYDSGFADWVPDIETVVILVSEQP